MSSTFNLSGSVSSLRHGVDDEVIEAVQSVRNWFKERYLLREMMPYGTDEKGTYLLIELLDPDTLKIVDNIHIDYSPSGLFIEDSRERDVKHMMTGKL